MELTLEEVKQHIEFMIDNNRKLQDRGFYPIAVNIEGEAGTGKTSIIDQIAKERDYNYISLSLSQISDPSDLVGFPIKEYYVCKEVDDPTECKCEWITAELLETYKENGYTLTSEIRMGYAIPAWLKTIDPTKPLILNLDDYSRASPAILQSCNEIICRQSYVSWSLPKYSTVVCTSNPENGTYLVNTLDEAMKSRLINYNVRFDVDVWARYAENVGIDDRGINFLLMYPEIMDRDENLTCKVNARSYTMFMNAISGIDDWSKPDNLAFILQIASGCFNDKDNYIGGLFTSFIANKLDKLISPEDLLLQKWDTVKPKIEKCVYDGNDYHPEIAAVLSTRLLNYSLKHLGTKGTKSQPVQERLIELVENSNDKDEKMLFSEDLLFNIIKTVVAKHSPQMNKLLLNPQIRKKII